MPLIDYHRVTAGPPAGAEGANAKGSFLRVRALSKTWRGNTSPTLNNLDLEMRAGEVISVEGRNGVGKTTLLRILGGLVGPDRGSVDLGGVRLGSDRRAYQRQVGLLTAGDRGLYARLTAVRHLDLWARLALLDGDARGPAIEASTDRFGLGEIADARVDRLSMGQRQRLRLALVFLHAPRLVLLDEPATSLDTAGVELLREAVGELVRHGGMCLAVTPEGAPTGLSPGRRLNLRAGSLEDA